MSESTEPAVADAVAGGAAAADGPDRAVNTSPAAPGRAAGETAGLATYWKVWGMLLALTVVMLFVDTVEMPPAAFFVVMVGAMLTKAGLITAYFMHMRHEHRFLQGMLLVGLLINGAFLYFLILPDAARIYRMVHG